MCLIYTFELEKRYGGIKMRVKKIGLKLISILLTLTVLFSGMYVPNVKISLTESIQVSAASFEEINNDNVFVKQQASNTCTLASAVMMVRRTAMLRGDSDWSSITEASMKKTAWAPGLYHNFTFHTRTFTRKCWQAVMENACLSKGIHRHSQHTYKK